MAEKVIYPNNEVINLGLDGVQASVTTVEDTTGVFDDYRMTYRPVPGYSNELYAPFGADDQLPYQIRELIGSDEVTAQNKLFNVLTCYGAGIQLKDRQGNPSDNTEAAHWAKRQNLPTYFLEQITDMKYFYFAVCCVILSKDGKKINRLVHKDACFCRLQKADRQGRIRYVYYADWKFGRPQ